jgi:hypothetical protein
MIENFVKFARLTGVKNKDGSEVDSIIAQKIINDSIENYGEEKGLGIVNYIIDTFKKQYESM